MLKTWKSVVREALSIVYDNSLERPEQSLQESRKGVGKQRKAGRYS